MEEFPDETPDFNEDITFPDDDEVMMNETLKTCDKTEGVFGRMLYRTPTIHQKDADQEQIWRSPKDLIDKNPEDGWVSEVGGVNSYKMLRQGFGPCSTSHAKCIRAFVSYC